MSTSILWQPTLNNKKRLDINGSSTFVDQARRVFGDFPITISANGDRQKVTTLAMINPDWDRVLDKLNEFGSIIISVEY